MLINKGMMKKRKAKHWLKDVKLKTVLIHPPLFMVHSPTFLYPPLGISMLQGFLKEIGYKNIGVFDFSYIYNKKIAKMTVKDRILYSIQDFLSFAGYKNIILGCYPQIPRPIKWSLNHLISASDQNYSFYKQEKNRIYRHIKSMVIKKKPDIIGISVNYPAQIFYSLLISRVIKELKADTFIVLGGAQISQHIKYLIPCKEVASVIDALIVSDGEEPLAKLIYQLSKGRSLKKVPNIYFKDYNSKNNCYYTKSQFQYTYNPKNLIIPDFSGFKIRKVLPIRASVGCSWDKCTFCNYRTLHKKQVCSEPEDVIVLIRGMMKKYGINHFYFVDDESNLGFLQKFSKLVLDKKIKIKWETSLILSPWLLNESVVRTFSEAGCERVRFGLESLSSRILKLMNKPQKADLQLVKNILALFKKYKVDVLLNVMFGFPSETESEAKATLDFLIKEKELYSTVVIQEFNLEDDTLILKNPSKFGIAKVYKEDKNYGTRLGFYYTVHKGMTTEKAKKFSDYARNVLDKVHKLEKLDIRIIKNKGWL